MPGWIWIVIGLVLFVVFLIVLSHWIVETTDGWRQEVRENGERTTAWIVDYEPGEGFSSPIILVLLCPDRDIPDDFMRGMVKKVENARARKTRDSVSAEVARMTLSHESACGRQRLPEKFTEGHEICAYFYQVFSDDAVNLPKDWLEEDFISVILMWGKRETTLVVPQRRKTRKRKRSD